MNTENILSIAFYGATYYQTPDGTMTSQKTTQFTKFINIDLYNLEIINLNDFLMIDDDLIKFIKQNYTFIDYVVFDESNKEIYIDDIEEVLDFAFSDSNFNFIKKQFTDGYNFLFEDENIVFSIRIPQGLSILIYIPYNSILN